MGQNVIIVNRGLVRNNKNEVLLIKRAKNDRWGAEKWELPGGKLEEGQHIDGALEREVLEETGLFVRRISPTVFVENEILTVGPHKGKAYLTLIGQAELIGGKLKISNEHDDYKWVNVEDVFDYDLTDYSRKALATFLKTV